MKIKKILIMMLSCIFVFSFAFLIACNTNSDEEDDSNSASRDDPVLGIWYGTQEDAGYTVNRIFYALIEYSEGNSDGTYNSATANGYQFEYYARYFRGDVYQTVGGYSETCWLNKKPDNVYTAIGFLDGFENIYGSSRVHYVFTLNEQTLTIKREDETGSPITMTPTTMTLDEFLAIDITPQE